METYLETIHVNEFRVSLCKFRLSSHDLPIEKGRHNNINRDNRLCTYCNMNVIENKFHFLLVYPKYRHLRIKYFKPIFVKLGFYTVPNGNRTPGRCVTVHYTTAAPRQLHSGDS